MNIFSMFAAVFSAIALRDLINYFVRYYEEKKHRERLRTFLDHLEDVEADDEDE